MNVTTTADFYIINTETTLWGMIPCVAISLVLLVLAFILFVAHGTHHLIPLVWQRFFNPNEKYEMNDKTSKIPLYLFCAHLLVFCGVCFLFCLLRQIMYIISYKDAGRWGHIHAMDALYGISIFLLCVSLLQYLTLISQVIHIWLRVVRNLDGEQLLKPWFYKITYGVLIVVNIIGWITLLGASCFLMIPNRLVPLSTKLGPIAGFAAAFGATLISLSLFSMIIGIYILVILYKSLKKRNERGKVMVMVRIAIFIIAFMIAAYIQTIGLLLASKLSGYVAFLILLSLPESIVVLSMWIAFWPPVFKLCCLSPEEKEEDTSVTPRKPKPSSHVEGAMMDQEKKDIVVEQSTTTPTATHEAICTVNIV